VGVMEVTVAAYVTATKAVESTNSPITAAAQYFGAIMGLVTRDEFGFVVVCFCCMLDVRNGLVQKRVYAALSWEYDATYKLKKDTREVFPGFSLRLCGVLFRFRMFGKIAAA
jgi:hypothetical protein